jgi:hypothetical protein
VAIDDGAETRGVEEEAQGRDLVMWATHGWICWWVGRWMVEREVVTGWNISFGGCFDRLWRLAGQVFVDEEAEFFGEGEEGKGSVVVMLQGQVDVAFFLVFQFRDYRYMVG